MIGHVISYVPPWLQDTLSQVKQLINSVSTFLLEDSDSDYCSLSDDALPSESDSIWFVTPEEADNLLHGQTTPLYQAFISRFASSQNFSHKYINHNIVQST